VIFWIALALVFSLWTLKFDLSGNKKLTIPEKTLKAYFLLNNIIKI